MSYFSWFTRKLRKHKLIFVCALHLYLLTQHFVMLKLHAFVTDQDEIFALVLMHSLAKIRYDSQVCPGKLWFIGCTWILIKGTWIYSAGLALPTIYIFPWCDIRQLLQELKWYMSNVKIQIVACPSPSTPILKLFSRYLIFLSFILFVYFLSCYALCFVYSAT